MKLLKTLIVVFVTSFFISCEKPLEQKFKDSQPVIKCEGLDYTLAHEAYYSYRQDLAVYLKSLRVGINHLDYKESIGRYIYECAAGETDFKKFVSPHTIEIVKRLKKQTDLWDTTNKDSNLNYNSPFIDCLIQGIKNEDFKQTVLSLRETNNLNPKILKENYRLHIYDVGADNHFGMLVAFDTYYQYLYDIDFEK